MSNDNSIVVSICCITYNHDLYIRDCLDGFVQQKTDFQFEILINDDASTDSTVQIIKEYVTEYPELIKPIFQEENQYSKGKRGINFLYNFPRAKGKYIALCEGDDYWIDPYKLQKQVDSLEANPEFGLVYTDVDIYYQDSGAIRPAVFKNGLSFADNDNPIRSFGYLGNASWVFRAKLLNHIDIYPGCPDGALLMFYEFAQHSKVHFLPDVTAVYRISAGTASRPTDEFRNYQYYKGIFYLQKRFLDKYNIKNMASDSVLMNSVMNLLPHAIRFQDDELVLEATTFFKSRNLSIDSYIQVCQKLLEAENDLKSVHAATSYRIGKLLLQPLKFLRKASGLDKYK